MNAPKSVRGIVTKSGFVPVLLPVFLFTVVACAARVVQETRQPGHASHRKMTADQANPTEATFLGYKRVEELSRANEASALRLLQTLVESPLSIRGNTFHSEKLAAYSPQGLLMGIVHSWADRAFAAAERGDVQTAHIYRESLRQIGDRLLTDSVPSVAAIETAYRFHSAAARVQARLQGNEPQPMARYEETMLREAWRTHFAPRLESHVPTGDAASEARFAEQIAREYKEAWSRIRAGEA